MQTTSLRRVRCFSSIFALAAVVVTTHSPAAAQDPQGPAVYSSTSPGVLRIRAMGIKDDGSMDGEDGTGFVVSNDGYVLTASHVVPDDESYTQLLIGGNLGPDSSVGKPLKLTLVKRNDFSDIALLKIDTPPSDLRVLPIRKAALKPGENIFVLGYPLGLPSAHILDGLIETVDATGILTTNALVDKGNSGGPVVDPKGCVVGVVFGGITKDENGPVNGLKFAVSLDSLKEFLPVLSAPGDPTPGAKQEDVIHVTDPVQRMQEDHNPLTAIVKSHHDVVKARAGFIIEAVEGVQKVSMNPPGLQFPTPVITPDGKSMTFDYTLISGPLYDQTRGWLDMAVSTKQRRIGSATNMLGGSCD